MLEWAAIPPPGNLPKPEIKPESLVPSFIAGRFAENLEALSGRGGDKDTIPTELVSWQHVILRETPEKALD